MFRTTSAFKTVIWALCLIVSPWASGQQAYPSKPLKIVVPFGAGGVADLTARTVAQKMGENMGQSIVIENKPGAGGVVATDAVAKSAPDGYTLLLMSNATAVSAGLFKSLPYDAEKDLIPLSVLGTFDIAIVVPQESKFANLSDLLAFAKANPGKLNIGSINVGSTQHLAAELFKSTAGIDAQVVPFNGTPAVLTALRGGQIDVGVEILAPVLPQIKGQALRALAVTGDKRAAALPQVPTAKEMGVKTLYAASWNALAAPAKTPRDIVQRLNQEIQSALNNTDVRKKLIDMNVDPQPGSLQQAADLLSSETKRWGDVIQRAGIAKQ
ncbi:MAG: tripartite tricarboxylate transporter substrate binding protein [Betaproteobacteria bacterium]|jgi:tripartite-type tricarboxylate transporter receptor subunit TctC|nr:tripartite tricarboxylate transporter substrate binding protein [Betaproteobacteria bacterium]NDB43461.1 tripartite tricarboxylate transporter substrate binding protein [Betaproteobacteria bacterium]NDD23813.1 tripartite tricarboxylate transporter substrate binding protein [Betaproteobacteria bacterium]NDE23855.1 tripartite tricarboxylate transporter substrate binding protein [Betaproteobacteria bacterium]NDF78938.1 tripartite tricarboxylate transporter substrate binding protein [Betaproteob